MNSFINYGITVPGTDALMLDRYGNRYESLGELLGKIKKKDIRAFNRSARAFAADEISEHRAFGRRFFPDGKDLIS